MNIASIWRLMILITESQLLCNIYYRFSRCRFLSVYYILCIVYPDCNIVFLVCLFIFIMFYTLLRYLYYSRWTSPILRFRCWLSIFFSLALFSFFFSIENPFLFFWLSSTFTLNLSIYVVVEKALGFPGNLRGFDTKSP